MVMDEYESKIAERINVLLDLKNVRSRTDYETAIFRASRKYPDLLNFFGLKRGSQKTGTEKLWRTSDTQSKINKSVPVSEYTGVYLDENKRKKYYD